MYIIIIINLIGIIAEYHTSITIEIKKYNVTSRIFYFIFSITIHRIDIAKLLITILLTQNITSIPHIYNNAINFHIY